KLRNWGRRDGKRARCDTISSGTPLRRGKTCVGTGSALRLLPTFFWTHPLFPSLTKSTAKRKSDGSPWGGMAGRVPSLWSIHLLRLSGGIGRADHFGAESHQAGDEAVLGL